MVAEVACVSKPWTVIPMTVAAVQDYIAAGQFRGGEQLLEAQQVTQPGTLLVFLEPSTKAGSVASRRQQLHSQRPSNYDVIASKDTGAARRILLHCVDALALVQILRLQALVLPLQTLVLSGHSRTPAALQLAAFDTKRTSQLTPRNDTPLS